jgi:predicted MFS family arabinose efflux permease
MSLLLERDVDTVAEVSTETRRSKLFPWVVFALTFGLLLSDYMSRQVLSAVFPFLKADWGLSDTQLGSLTSIVALTVGVLAVPLSVLGDRWGRTRAIVAMAGVWSLATLGSALAANYEQMLLARALIGVGEAAYGSVGLAVVLAVFPAHRRASLTGAFMAGGTFGAVLGVAVGGNLAAHLGWRWSFATMAIFGLVLVVLYRLLVSDRKLARYRYTDANNRVSTPTETPRARLHTLFSTPSVICAYIASGLQLLVAGALFAWLPSYLNRAYHLTPAKAASYAAMFILIVGAGMIYCGAFTDRIARRVPVRKWTSAIVYATCSLVFLGSAFALHPGVAQILLLGVGAFFAAGTAGPAGAMVANLTDESIRATALGTLTLANNLLGLAAGPFLVGVLADRFGLAHAMKFVPLASIPVIVALLIGRHRYPASLRKVNPAALEVREHEAHDAAHRKPVAMLIVTGILLQAIAALLALVIAPKATVLPEKADVTAHLSGTVSMLNAKAIKAHDLAHVFLRDIPVTVDRRVHVTATHGNTAIVAVDQTLHVGPNASTSTHDYAVNRTDRQATTAPAGVTVEPAHGLVIGYPVSPKPRSGVYSSYDPTTQLSGTATFVGKSQRDGRTVYGYQTAITGPVKDAGILAGLPVALPKPALLGIASRLPAAAQAKLMPALATLAPVVPLHYTSTSNVIAYVDSVTGSTIDQSVSQQVVAGLTVNGNPVNLAPVMALDVKVTPASIHMLAARAAKVDRLLTLIGQVIPVALVAIGLLLEAAAVIRRQRQRAAARVVLAA